jgi:hypothetical protein
MSKNPPGAGAYAQLKDVCGRYRTKSLFIEHQLAKYPAPFTLADLDKGDAVSMKRKYMEIGDPTEYTQAIALLGDWAHWKHLAAAPWFKVRYLNGWRRELAVKIESDCFREMKRAAKDKENLQAVKWIAERYAPSKTAKRGRPSKAEKEAAIQQSVEEDQLLKEEAERLKL